MKKKNTLCLAVLIAAALLSPLPGTARTVTLPNDISWVLTSDTYLGVVQQAYLNAINRLRVLAEGKKPGTWCVVVDADETIISNVVFQAEQAARGEGYTQEAWNAWCRRMEATALPGAIEFLGEVRELGGKVIVITNRQAPLREVTVQNLEKVGIPFDACLLREGPYRDDRDKTQRRADIEKGTVRNLPLGQRLPPLEILMLAGDQPHDLYKDKSFDEVKDRYGKDLIIIPNPMYGDGMGSTYQVPARRIQRPAAAQPRRDVITWQEAMDRVGETVTVEAEIIGFYDPATRGGAGPVRLNTDRDWDNSLAIIFFNKDGQFGDPARFDGKTVRARGRVQTFRDSVQLRVFGPDAIEIVD